MQRIGHLGDAQDDFNLRGHLHPWWKVDQFFWARATRPQSIAQLTFRAYRRLPDGAAGEGATRYRFKIWPADRAEPAAWSFEHVLQSATALRQGGLALLAHHIDASFGDVSIVSR